MHELARGRATLRRHAHVCVEVGSPALSLDSVRVLNVVDGGPDVVVTNTALPGRPRSTGAVGSLSGGGSIAPDGERGHPCASMPSAASLTHRRRARRCRSASCEEANETLNGCTRWYTTTGQGAAQPTCEHLGYLHQRQIATPSAADAHGTSNVSSARIRTAHPRCQCTHTSGVFETEASCARAGTVTSMTTPHTTAAESTGTDIL